MNESRRCSAEWKKPAPFPKQGILDDCVDEVQRQWVQSVLSEISSGVVLEGRGQLMAGKCREGSFWGVVLTCVFIWALFTWMGSVGWNSSSCPFLMFPFFVYVLYFKKAQTAVSILASSWFHLCRKEAINRFKNGQIWGDWGEKFKRQVYWS